MLLNRWQVQLAKGEPVTVIGRSEREGPDGPQLWYRIVPPSGEYRWVHRDTVVESTESLVEIAQRSRNAVECTVCVVVRFFLYDVLEKKTDNDADSAFDCISRSLKEVAGQDGSTIPWQWHSC